MWMCKSKQLKAVGKASFLPCIFGVNEPVLFAAPMVLNPYFFVPFLLAPIANAWVFKFFVDVLQMNSFIYVLPWATPAPIGIFLGTGMAPLSLLLVLALIALDVVIYLPFVKAYDANLLAEEANSQQEEPNTIEESKPSLEKSEIDPLNVLVLCVGAGTSAMFANAVNKGAEIKDLPVKAQAEAFGGHTGVLSEVQLVVLSPQVQSRYDEIKADADRYGIKVVKTKGAQYIGLTKDPEGAVDFVVNQANTKEE